MVLFHSGTRMKMFEIREQLKYIFTIRRLLQHTSIKTPTQTHNSKTAASNTNSVLFRSSARSHSNYQRANHMVCWSRIRHMYGVLHCRLSQLRHLHCSRPLQDENYHQLSAENNLTLADEILGDERHAEYMREYYRIPDTGQRLFVIQPDLKRGPQKANLTTAELQLAEACALVNSLQNWKVQDKRICRVKSLNTRHVFGRGTLEDLTGRIVRRTDISAVFLSINMMSGQQLAALQDLWGLPVLDRYSVVLEIFKSHANSKEAKLQVALAEIPYIRTRLKGLHDGTISRPSGGMQHIGGSGETYLELRQRFLQEREFKLKKALEKVKSQRAFLRSNRSKKEYPIIAVVGYTNAGKTSLIKAVTGDNKMMPSDELFATLDVTSHAGYLPCNMTALFIDTVGFMSDIPTMLIDAFSATLEDALLADVVVHVRDISHPDTTAQCHNVNTTLSSLLSPEQMGGVIEVCNKADLLSQIPDKKETGLMVSAISGLGLEELLKRIEGAALLTTAKSHRRVKIPLSGPHLSWLYSEATVQSCEPTPDSEHLVVDVIISDSSYAKFKARFSKQKHSP